MTMNPTGPAFSAFLPSSRRTVFIVVGAVLLGLLLLVSIVVLVALFCFPSYLPGWAVRRRNAESNPRYSLMAQPPETDRSRCNIL